MKNNLTKENFWDALYETYPDAMQEFCDWIDQYKAENNWDALFKEGVKYHHLPIEIQVGLWVAFIFELFPGGEAITYDDGAYDHEGIYEWVSEHMNDRQITFNVQQKALEQ